MEISTFKIEGPKLISLKKFGDHRGFFTERFRKDAFAASGLPSDFVQDNFSRSEPDVLRGVHFQFDLPQGKLVTCLSGHIFDVAVDIRQSSPTYGQYVSVELKGDEPSWFWVPAGFAHGFCVLGKTQADVLYRVDNFYNAKGEAGIVWNDVDFNIQWPIKKPVLSPKDELAMTFKEYKVSPKF